jgi:predicted dehydrogenase
LLGPTAAGITHYPGGHTEGFPDTFKQLYLDVYRWIVEGRPAGRPPTFPTFHDGDQEVRICEAIARSAAEGRWVSVSEVQS